MHTKLKTVGDPVFKLMLEQLCSYKQLLARRTCSFTTKQILDTCGERVEHAQSGAGNSKPVGQGEGNVDGDGDDKAGHNGGFVAQSQSKDDVRGSSCAAGVGNILQKIRYLGLQAVAPARKQVVRLDAFATAI